MSLLVYDRFIAGTSGRWKMQSSPQSQEVYDHSPWGGWKHANRGEVFISSKGPQRGTGKFEVKSSLFGLDAREVCAGGCVAMEMWVVISWCSGLWYMQVKDLIMPHALCARFGRALYDKYSALKIKCQPFVILIIHQDPWVRRVFEGHNPEAWSSPIFPLLHIVP